ncbi:MAG: serine/threonine-protein kinase [Planctomycetota bacterium]
MNLDLQAIRLMEAALDLPLEDREAYVNTACDGDTKLLAKVHGLLAAADDEEGFLATRSADVSGVELQVHQDRIGDYRILREIGRGGMGIVYEAQHDAMQRRVALKTLACGATPTENQLARFHREARAAGQLHHTNIVPVFEVGSAAGVHFYTMQYIDGANLDAVITEIRELRRSRPTRITSDRGQTVAKKLMAKSSRRSDAAHLDSTEVSIRPTANEPVRPVAESTESVFVSDWSSTRSTRDAYFRRAAAIGLQAAEALHYAHQNGTLHRDIKPANLMVDTDGTVWILDFGLAKSQGEDLTRSGDVLGTIRYMAPERFRGKADERSDLYSLGLVLYELTTLRYAYDAGDQASLMKQVTGGAPPSPRTIDRRIPKDLETIILKLLDRNPNRRYDTAAELAEDLQLYIMDHPIHARRISPLEKAWRVCRRNPVVSSMAASLIALLVLIAIGSSQFAYLSNLQKQQALNAERSTRLRRYELNYQSARGLRRSDQLGRRYDALRSISEAKRLLPTLDFPKQQRQAEVAELRTEAMAALALFDMRPVRTWPVRIGSAPGSDEPIVAFNADHSAYAIADPASGDIRVHSVDREKPLRVFPRRLGNVYNMTFSPDGRFVVAKHQAQATQICVWDLDDGRSSANPTAEVESEPLIAVDSHFHGYGVVSHDGQTVAISGDGFVKLFSLPDGELRTTVKTEYPVKAIQLAEDGKSLATCELRGAKIDLWATEETPTLQAEVQLPEDADGLYTVCWSANRNLLIAGLGDGSVLVWRQGLDRPPQHYPLHKHTVTRVFLHPNQPWLFTQAWDETVRVFDLVAETQICRLERHALSPSGPSRDGRRIGITTLDQQRFGSWEIAEPCLKHIPVDRSNLKAVSVFRYAALHPKHPHLLVTGHEGGVFLDDTRTQKRLAQHLAHGSSFIHFSNRDDSLCILSAEGSIRLPLTMNEDASDVAFGEPSHLLDALPNAATLELTPNQQSVLAVFGQSSNAAYAELISVSDPNERVRFTPHAKMTSAHISPDGKWVATSSWKGTGVRLWDAQTGRFVTELLPKLEGTHTRFSPDGKYLVCAQRSKLFVWKVGAWDEVFHEIARKRGIMGRLAFADRLFVGNQTRFEPQLIDLSSGKWITRVESPTEDVVRSFSFSPDGSKLVIAGTEFTHLWELDVVRQHLSTLDLDW